jgi:hypothetical protein
MAHRKREVFIPELLAKLDRPAEVVWDQIDNRWDTGRRSMLAYDPQATHHLVVQDDAVIPRDLVAGIEKALRVVPAKTPLCLYAGKVRPFRAAVQQLVDRAGQSTSWLSMSQCHWGVGIVMPTELIRPMVAWCDTRTEVANYDKRISRWCQSRRLTVFYPWPSLVDHRDSPSLVPGRVSTGRRAHKFVGADESALSCDWSGQVVSIPALSRYARPVVRVDGQLGRWQMMLRTEQRRLATSQARIKTLQARIAAAQRPGKARSAPGTPDTSAATGVVDAVDVSVATLSVRQPTTV